MHKIDVFHQPSTRQVVLVGETHASSYYVSDLKEELGGIISDHLAKAALHLFGTGMMPHCVVTIDDDGKIEVNLASAKDNPSLPADEKPSSE